MAPRLQWSVELVSDEFIVPRLEDHLIDELFYQEDEIGEMRHTAFMVECGLEEDPPEGPDVPPVPWGDMILKQQQEQQQKQQNKAISPDENPIFDSDSDSDDEINIPRPKRELPNRSRSTDDIDTLAIELTSSQRTTQKRPPKRSNSTPAEMFVIDGQSSQSPYSQFPPSSPGNGASGRSENRRPARRVPSKVSPETPPKRKTPVRGGLTKTRSGTTHEMASAAARARKKLNEEKNDKNDGPKYRKLTKTTSGTCREMANAAAKARKKLDAEKAKKKAESDLPVSSPSVSERRKAIESKDVEKKGRPAPLVRGLVATKSGTKHKIASANGSSKDSDDEDGASPKIVYKNGKRTSDRRRSSVRLKSKSNASSLASDSGDEKKKEKIVYRNGKRESIKQYNSLSDSSVDDDFLGDIVRDFDDESIGRSDISISTVDSDSEDLLLVPKSIQSPLKIPTRQRSLSTKDGISDDNLSDDLSPKSYDLSKKKKKKKKDGMSDDSSLHSTKSLKKKKKKKDKENGVDDSSVHSSKSLKKRKKKKDRESLDDSTKDNSIYSPRQTSRKQNDSIYGDLQPGCYPSPSSIRSQNRTCFKKSPRMEPVKDDSSKPSIIKIGSPGFYPSPSAIKSESRKRLSGSKKFETQSPTPSIFEIEKQRQGLASRPDDFLVTDPLAAIKKKKEREKSGFSSPRPDDWLGSGSKARRSWRVKSKPADN